MTPHAAALRSAPSEESPPSPALGSMDGGSPATYRDDADAAAATGLSDAAASMPHLIPGRSLTFRGVAVGLLVGLVICFSNMYFGLQTGWVSTMTMPASLMGFGFFKLLSRHLEFPFSPVENVLVQTVAGSMAIMPLGCGFVGVLPAMNYLLTPEENGPLDLSIWKLILWSLGLCYFGVVFAVPLRRQVIIREQLKFPSGFSTAVLIGVLHGQASVAKQHEDSGAIPAGFASLAASQAAPADLSGEEDAERSQLWRKNVQILLLCFFVSGIFTFATYFIPILRNIPIFGSVAAATWLWTLNPSLAYVGQGIIMGPATTLHMLLGAIVGWAVLSPLAKHQGWAPGPIDDWESGSKGWIVWVSLAIMLADAVASLGYVALRSLWQYSPGTRNFLGGQFTPGDLKALLHRRPRGYASVSLSESEASSEPTYPSLSNPRPVSPAASSKPYDDDDDDEHDDAPPDQQISNRVVGVGLVLSILFCIFCTHVVFGDLVPLYATVVAVFMALVLSIMGVRALGETDLNPVSGISKLAQLFFAFIIPQSNKSSVLINLVAGAVSEAGALQAGDLMQDLKTGHLLGAAPSAQFWGQVVGATVGAIVSAFIYRLYTAVYEVPGDLFQVPTGYVWIFTASFGVLFAILTAARIYGTNKRWQAYIPGGIAVAIGMYNVPSFTLARTIGGLFGWWWRTRMGWEETPLIVLASGFILGEGFLSIVNLIMQSLRVPAL